MKRLFAVLILLVIGVFLLSGMSSTAKLDETPEQPDSQVAGDEEVVDDAASPQEEAAEESPQDEASGAEEPEPEAVLEDEEVDAEEDDATVAAVAPVKHRVPSHSKKASILIWCTLGIIVIMLGILWGGPGKIRSKKKHHKNTMT